MSSANGSLLEVNDLRTYFDTEDGVVKAVDGISFRLKRGETLGIVGESGSGKSVTNLSIIRLIPDPPGRIVGGEVVFNGQDILLLSGKEVRKIRGRRIAMIFQDPMTSLNPFLKISRQLMEMTQLHLGHTKAQAYQHEKNAALVSYLDCERLYADELLGGHLRRYFDELLEEVAPKLDTRIALIQLMWEAAANAEKSVPVEA